jgi:hypothetical protein
VILINPRLKYIDNMALMAADSSGSYCGLSLKALSILNGFSGLSKDFEQRFPENERTGANPYIDSQNIHKTITFCDFVPETSTLNSLTSGVLSRE